MKFTFRKEKRRTGLAGVGHPHADVAIKHLKKRVGTIHAPSWSTKDHCWGVMLMLEGNDENLNIDWHWVRIKQRFETEQAARDYLNANVERLLALNLHHEEDDRDE